MSGHTGPVDAWFGSAADAAQRAHFRVQRDPNGDVYPDWEAEEHLSIRHYWGTKNNDVYDGGEGPDTLTLVLWFDDRENYQRFLGMRRTTGTLQLLASFTSATGASFHHHGRDYERFDNVMPRRPRRVLHRIGGLIECEATFLLLSEGT